jgi:putative tryptophan/tyrosine transport system substrate-binding protein
MRRREVIALLGGIAWPTASRAQGTSIPIIGFLSSLSASSSSHGAGLREGLRENGFVEGRNVLIEYRWAEGRYDRLPAFAAELVSRNVGVILAAALPAALAAKTATSAVPIVFVSGADPVKLGLVASMREPGGNATGVFQYFGALGGKRLELLRELMPRGGLIAVLSNPTNPNTEDHLHDIEAAARAMGQPVQVFDASSEADIETELAGIAEAKAGGILVADDPLFTVHRAQIVARAAQHALPAIYYSRQFAAAGGLISYGTDVRHIYRQAAVYVARILRGAIPADLPVVQPTTFELVVNMRTAKALGLTIPPTLLARADEVIE